MTPSRVIVGLAFIAYGIIKLAEELGWFYIPWHSVRRYWPVALIVLGIWLLVRKKEEPPYNPPHTTGSFPTDPAAPQTPQPPQPPADPFA